MATGSDPGGDAVAVTPSDSTRLNGVRGLYIGVSGDVVVKMDRNSVAVTFKSVPIGILPISAVILMATGTTATNILALY